MIRVLRLDEDEAGRRIVFDGHSDIELMEGEESPFVPGETLTGEEFRERMLSLSEPVVKVGARILAARSLSMKLFLRKLREKGIPPSRADFIAEYFSDMGILDDEAYARLLLESLREKGKGPYVVRQELRARGISPDIIETLMEDDADETDGIERYLNAKVRRLPIDEKEYRRHFAALLRRGFAADDIKSALARRKENPD